ncbi:MAG TPA: MATE family efflux transporter [Actinobacteria bacterium]|nr:MATE family efflux transporter [Actinomycetota bacterium]
MKAAWASRRHDAEILRLAVPALGALAIDPLVSLVDTAFVGRLGAVALGAVALGGVVFAVAFAVFNVLEYGVTPYVAHALGAGDRARAERMVSGALGVGVVVGLAVAVGLWFAAVPLLRVLGAGPELVGAAVAYLRIRALALPAVLVAMAAHGAYRGFQDTRTPLVVTGVANLVNVVLDPLLIFGAGWGVSGAAAASAIAQGLAAAVFLVLVQARRGSGLGIRWRRPDPEALGSLWGAGRALVLRTAALLAVFTAAAAVAARVSTTALAAHQVVVQLWLFLALVLDALAIAAQALVARALGAGDPSEARALADRLVALGVTAGFVLAAGLGGVAPWIGGWFTDDRAVVAAIGAVYPFVVGMQPLNGAVFVWDGVAMGAEAFGYLAVTTAASALPALALLGLVIPMDLGLAGVWWAIVAMMALRAIALASWRRRGLLAVPGDHDPGSRGVGG